MAWTLSMNQHVMRCYYLASKMETIPGYRAEMRKLFLDRFPDCKNVSEQRLMDQKRVILKSCKMSADDLQNIKDEVQLEISRGECEDEENVLEADPASVSCTDGPVEQRDIVPGLHTDEGIVHAEHDECATDTADENVIKADTLEVAFIAEMIKWQGVSPNLRQSLPKLPYTPKLFACIERMNRIIPAHIREESTLEEVHCIIYCAAQAITQAVKGPTNHGRRGIKLNAPRWQLRIERKVANLRQEIGRVTQCVKGNTSKRLRAKMAHVNEENLLTHLDTLKQKLKVQAARLRRYKKSYQRHLDNALFQRNERAFYRRMGNAADVRNAPEEIPSKDDVTRFWRSIWSEAKEHNSTAPWIEQETVRHAHITHEGEVEITKEDVRRATLHIHNWKAPGPDKVHNFWLKKLTCVHTQLSRSIQDIITHPDKMPIFLTEGVTFAKHKGGDSKDPSEYRPITCLSTLYKVITSIVTRLIGRHVAKWKILCEEQKGCRKGSFGCKELLIIDSVVLKQAVKERRNLHVGYIDYKKAFDSMPHSWLIHVLNIYRVHPVIVHFLKSILASWRTRIIIQGSASELETEVIHILRGIFQGDSLSALWFCLGLNPLSNCIREMKVGFPLRRNRQVLHVINHLAYLDDIKIYASQRDQLHQLFKVIEEVSDDIGMMLGVPKCATLHIENGVIVREDGFVTNSGDVINSLTMEDAYKYLGMWQSSSIQKVRVKEHLVNTFVDRLSAILKTSLNSKHTTKAINTFAIPALAYSFGVVPWSDTELEGLNRKVRTLMTKWNKHHPRAAKERIHIPRKQGGRGILDVKEVCHSQVRNLRNYFLSRNDSTLHAAVNAIDKSYTPLRLACHDLNEEQPSDPVAGQLEAWASKPLHGRFYHSVAQDHVSEGKSFLWLSKGQLYPETEGFVLAIQDQVISTRNYKRYILKEKIESDKCRKCNAASETIDHITSGCALLAGKEYTERHNNMAKIIHLALANDRELCDTAEPYYKYCPATVLENQRFRLYWDNPILTDKTIMANRPDIVLVDKRDRTAYIIDISIPNNHNLELKYQEKMVKYLPLAAEMKRLWNLNIVCIKPLIMSVTGIVPKSLVQHLRDLGINSYLLHSMQKSVVISTSSIVRSFLNIE